MQQGVLKTKFIRRLTIQLLALVSMVMDLSLYAQTVSPPNVDSPGKKPVLQLTLGETIKRALGESAGLRQLREELNAASAVRSQAVSKFLPTISLDGDVGTARDRTPIPGDPDVPEVARERNFYNGRITLTQNLFSGFGHTANFKVASTGEQAAELALKAKEGDVLLEAIRVYFTIQLRLKELEAEREIATLRNRQYESMKSRAKFGRATELELLQAQQAVQSQVPTIRELESKVEGESLKLARLLGLQLDQPFALIDSLDEAAKALQEQALPDLAKAYQQTLKQNPGLLKSEVEFEKAIAQIRSVNSTNLPQLDFVLSAGTNANRRDEIASEESMVYTGMLRFSVPVFTGLSSFSSAKEAQARLNAEREERATLREKTLDDLRANFRLIELSTDKIKAEQANVQVADLAVVKAEAFNRVGRATLNEVLDSYSKKLEAKKGLANAFFDRIVAIAQIKAILGAF